MKYYINFSKINKLINNNLKKPIDLLNAFSSTLYKPGQIQRASVYLLQLPSSNRNKNFRNANKKRKHYLQRRSAGRPFNKPRRKLFIPSKEIHRQLKKHRKNHREHSPSANGTKRFFPALTQNPLRSNLSNFLSIIGFHTK